MFNNKSLNDVTLVGRVGRDSELKTSASGVNYARIALATSEMRKDGNEWKEVTTWHDLTVFGERAVKLSPKLLKGAFVIVKGSISYREVMTADNRKIRSAEIRVEDVTILSTPKTATQQPRQAAPATAPAYDDGLIC